MAKKSAEKPKDVTLAFRNLQEELLSFKNFHNIAEALKVLAVKFDQDLARIAEEHGVTTISVESFFRLGQSKAQE